MDASAATHARFGPPALGRGAVVGVGGRAPDHLSAAPRVVIDNAVLEDPGSVAETLYRDWLTRTPHIIELAIEPQALKQPEVNARPPFELGPHHTFHRERLAFGIWANNVDLRDNDPVWWHGVLATRHTGAETPHGDDMSGDIVLPDGRTAWVDGGPRGPITGIAEGTLVIHRESVSIGRLTTSPTDLPPLDGLAPDQAAAVAHRSGPTSVIAPAGSGKTRVLVARLRHLLHDRGVEPDLVTVVAYNTRAARELRNRADAGEATIRTIHALALWICNLDRRRRVIDEHQVRGIVGALVHVPRAPNQDPMRPWLDALTDVRLGLADPHSVEATRGDVDGFAEFFPRFRQVLANEDLLDFDEQIYRAIELLLTSPSIRATVQRRATHLLVDEFQDLTPAFVLMLRLMAAPAGQLFAVGDDDQTIYGYAGADPRYLVDLDRWFPGAAQYVLDVNYRCPADVVDAATNLLSHNEVRVDKSIRPTARAPEHGLDIHCLPAGRMTERALDLVTTTDQNSLAILARVMSALLPVQVALTEHGIGHSAPLDRAVLQRTGLRSAFAYLRIACAPDAIRPADILETINRPVRKLRSSVEPHLSGRNLSLADLRRQARTIDADHRQGFDAYVAELSGLAQLVGSGAATDECLRTIREDIGLGKAMEKLDTARRGAEGSSHTDDLDGLAQLASLHPDPRTFAAWVTEKLAVGATEGGVTLSTIHRVKGMEWDHVVVFAVNAGVLPHRLAPDDEEERRLLHVALTRGRQRVDVLADAGRPSSFLDELRQRRTTPFPIPPSREAPHPPNAAGRDPRDLHPSTDGVSTEHVFEALRRWRARSAAALNVPAFLILHDRHLRAVCARRPATLDELAACPGIGPVKLERYGQEILDVLHTTT